jgi:hypothetical protein
VSLSPTIIVFRLPLENATHDLGILTNQSLLLVFYYFIQLTDRILL